ncbi:O-methyltransferase-domain-containing protein [Crucibulum laeve]|uniref:O-methyltransferase-domain-containing protein n=1 Tax=Crucibulum laeve TaxID=68775 RepID=A0A5C3LRZ8_9AGAR|nr:O-methyltransferase-domain-containing protein [Crucibulum laeve]
MRTPWIIHENTNVDDWTRSDAYSNSFLIGKDDVLTQIEKSNVAQGLPDISVTPAQGKFLKLLVQTTGAKRVLEVGTLGGHSTIWMARGLPKDGEIVTLEISKEYADVAEANFKVAGVADKIKTIVGPAIDTMSTLDPFFDFVFIDADKPSNLAYFTEAKRLVRKGGVIIVDNMVQYGRTADLNYSDIKVEGARTVLKALKGDKDVDATVMGTVGEKGYDGFLYAVRN